MFVYQKKLEYPVKIANPDPKLAAIVISQYGGPYGFRIRFGDFYHRQTQHLGVSGGGSPLYSHV